MRVLLFVYVLRALGLSSVACRQNWIKQRYDMRGDEAAFEDSLFPLSFSGIDPSVRRIWFGLGITRRCREISGHDSLTNTKQSRKQDAESIRGYMKVSPSHAD